MAISGSLNFISASSTGSNNIKVDFVGLNTLVVDPVSASTNQLGYNQEKTAGIYFNNSIESIYPAEGGELNSILLNRNGPYQHPSWKQYRNANHPVARSLRLANTMSFETKEPNPLKLEENKKNLRDFIDNDKYYSHYELFGKNIFDVRNETIIEGTSDVIDKGTPVLAQFYEPVITTKHSPFIYERGLLVGRLSLMNQIADFSNQNINSLLKLASGNPKTGSQISPHTLSNDEVYKLFHLIKKHQGRNFVYSETLYPKDINSYRGFKLQKGDYEQVPGLGKNGYDAATHRLFWKNSQPSRARNLTSDGTTRVRTDGVALSAIETLQKLKPDKEYSFANSTSRQLISSSLWQLSSSNPNSFPSYGTKILTSSILANVAKGSNPSANPTFIVPSISTHLVEYTTNGIVVNPVAAGYSSGAFFQRTAYQPYPISLLSAWPLDTRDDVYDFSNVYLSSDLGGQGRHIGLTPFNGAGSNILIESGASGIKAFNTGTFTGKLSVMATASAGELVYSTKPTIFFWRNSTAAAQSELILSGTTMGKLNCHSGTFELQDAQGNRVPYMFDKNLSIADGTRRIRTVDGKEVLVIIIGLDGVSTTGQSHHQIMVRAASTINGTTATGNGFTLNITATASANTVTFKQTTPGTGKSIKVGKYVFPTASGLTFLRGPAGSTTAGDFFAATENGSTGSLDNDAFQGYRHPTASMQYNRHTFPYNTPFYVTNRVRERDPFYNSYSDYSTHFDLLGKDHSILPEFKFSDHADFYTNLYQFSIINNDNLFIKEQVGNKYKFVRNVQLGSLKADTQKFIHKPNFLRIDGAEVTSSASGSTPEKSTNRYEYDDISGAKLISTNEEDKFTYKNNQINVAFDGKFANTDTLINFSSVMTQQGLGFEDDVRTIPEQINFEATAIKKLLPYNGFYPVLRTLQIGNAFKKDWTGAEGYEGAMDQIPVGQGSQAQAHLQALLEPFMAPGILYNSIKSGIAVNYPIYTGSVKYYYPNDFVTNNTSSATQKKEFGMQPEAISSSFHGGLYMMGSSRCIPSILTSKPHLKLPFKALYDSKEDTVRNILAGAGTQGERPFIHLPSDFVDLDRAHSRHNDIYEGKPSYTQGEYLIGEPKVKIPNSETGMARVEAGTYYQKINNFLSETMEFFLADVNGSKLPVALSNLTETSANTFYKNGANFFMNLSLRMGKHQVSCEGPRRAGIGNPQSAFDQLATDKGYFLRNSTMRGYIYGPPVEIVPRISGTITWTPDIGKSKKDAGIAKHDYASYFAANLQDPAYHAYTPPYFYGKSNFIYKYTGVGSPKNLSEVVASLNNSFYLDEYSNQTLTGSTINNYILHTDSLCLTTPSTGSVSSGSLVRMKADASIEILSSPVEIQTSQFLSVGNDSFASEKTHHVWYVAPHWVCPVLDFSSSISFVDEKTKNNLPGENVQFSVTPKRISNSFHDFKTGRGLWGGYGIDPYDSDKVTKSMTGLGYSEEKQIDIASGKGIYMEISDFSLNGSGENIVPQSVIFQDATDDSKYFENIESSFFAQSDSLADKLGFEKKSYPIGKIAEQKNVKEGIVLIPYLEEQIIIHLQEEYFTEGIYDRRSLYTTRELIPGKHFLPIHDALLENILNLHMVEKLQQISKGALNSFIGEGDGNEAARHEMLEETDVGRLISKLSVFSDHGGYSLPPEFDFVHNKSVPPFQMILIEMNHTFDKQDLLDIYQGIMPHSAKNAEKIKISDFIRPGYSPANTSFIPKHGFEDVFEGSALENFGITNFLSPLLATTSETLAQPFFNVVNPGTFKVPFKNHAEFYKNLKFMVFKVKQRAKKDYGNYRKEQINRTILKQKSEILADQNIVGEFFDFFKNKQVKDVYGSNWPYDFFSMMETAKIDIKFEVKK